MPAGVARRCACGKNCASNGHSLVQGFQSNRAFIRRVGMVIYGTALLAFCHLTGLFLGDLLGSLIGVKSNVGGVGIAMLMLIALRIYLPRIGAMPKDTEAGVGFWGAMYIPVVVAMAAQQNVVAALKGGPVALIAAVGAVLVSACCIAVLSRTGDHAPLPPMSSPEATPSPASH